MFEVLVVAIMIVTFLLFDSMVRGFVRLRKGRR